LIKQFAMKKVVWFFAASALCSSPFMLAQQQTQAPASVPARPAFQMPAPTPNDTLKSVEVQPDRHVRFRIWAPNANDVKLQAEGPEATPGITPEEAYKNMGGVPMVKGDQGIWEVTIGPIEPGIYRYTFIVNGVTTRTRVTLSPRSRSPSRAACMRFPVPNS
jgi:enterochelin esterase family protein